MVVLGGWAFSYERGTPVGIVIDAFGGLRDKKDAEEEDIKVFKAHRLVYRSTLGWRVIQKRRRGHQGLPASERRENNLKRFNGFFLVCVVYLVIYDAG